MRINPAGWLPFLFAGLLVAGVWGYARDRVSDPAPSTHSSAITPAGNEPWKISPLALPQFAGDSVPARIVAQSLLHPPSAPMQAPIFCHLLLAYRLGLLPLAQLSSGQDVVRALTDASFAQARFGQSILFPTRDGVRFKLISPNGSPSQQGESHRDLCLATFAEIGLPLSTPLHTAGATFALRDLLSDSIASFDMNESEIAWTAIAYDLYLPPRQTWTNRDGQTFSFDDLAQELARRPLGQASCGGAHVLMAMTLLLRVDEQTHVLSPANHQMLLRRLRDCAQIAAAYLSPQGWWTVGWEQNSRVRSVLLTTRFYKLLVTGHLLEWLEYLPPAVQPDAAIYRRAATWISGQLISPSPWQGADFCPWTHATCAVRNLVM